MLFVHASVVRYTLHTEVLPLVWLSSPGRSVEWLLGAFWRVVRPSTHLLIALQGHCQRTSVRAIFLPVIGCSVVLLLLLNSLLLLFLRWYFALYSSLFFRAIVLSLVKPVAFWYYPCVSYPVPFLCFLRPSVVILFCFTVTTRSLFLALAALLWSATDPVHPLPAAIYSNASEARHQPNQYRNA